MLGVILCGGKSSRMGTDKGLLTEGDKRWSQIALEKLSSLPLQCVVSINQLQLDAYSSFFSNDQLVLDKDELKAGGPLLGLLSVHSRFPSEDLFVIACDMPKMELNALREISYQQMQFPDFEAYVFSDGVHIEPLCGIYTATGWKKILSALKENKLQKQSMIHTLSLLNTKYLLMSDEWRPYFQNRNTLTD